jgi:acetyltransferase-like isoleucine patch superfamily enzyme
MKDKIFFILQGFLKYNAFNFGVNLRSFFYRPFFKRFGKNIKIRDGVNFKYPSEIELGNNIKIEQHCFFVGKGGLSIGDNCLFGAGTKVITSDHVADNIEEPVFNQGLKFKKVVIESDVWFGFDVKVLAGSVIRKSSVIGTNTLINSIEVEEYSVMAGTPARLIKKRK